MEEEKIVTVDLGDDKCKFIGVFDYEMPDEGIRINNPLSYAVVTSASFGDPPTIVFSQAAWGIPPSMLIKSTKMLCSAATPELAVAYKKVVGTLKSKPIRCKFAIKE